MHHICDNTLQWPKEIKTAYIQCENCIIITRVYHETCEFRVEQNHLCSEDESTSEDVDIDVIHI